MCVIPVSVAQERVGPGIEKQFANVGLIAGSGEHKGRLPPGIAGVEVVATFDMDAYSAFASRHNGHSKESAQRQVELANGTVHARACARTAKMVILDICGGFPASSGLGRWL